MTSPDTSLARAVDAAQSILATDAAVEAKRLELAFADGSREFALCMARLSPESGASAKTIAGGLSVFAGEGSPLTQALAMGLCGPVMPADLDSMEAHLCPSAAGSMQLELCPFADPSLPALLARRGYRVHEWQLVWVRDVPHVPAEPQSPPPPELRVRRVLAGEEELFFRVVMAGFLESEEVPAAALEMMRPSAFAARHELYLAWLGDEAIGGATLAWSGDVAIVAGSGVRPAFRRRGAQGALIRARLDRARELGCRIACSTTLPGTASRRNMERHGFHVAYPKVVMLRER